MNNVISRAYLVASVLINRAELLLGVVAASLFVWATVWVMLTIP
jgi:hypothetical protein